MTATEICSPKPISDSIPAHIHVPTPGDHYSPATGSAIMTVIYEMARSHVAMGGKTQIIVVHGTRHDYPVGECVEVPHSRHPERWQKAVDVILGRIGIDRPFGAGYYQPSCNGIPQDFDGFIFVHNNAVAIPRFAKCHPRARVCLWAHNEIFRTYSDAETRRIALAAYRIICCSNYVAGKLRARIGCLAEKVKVVYNGVDSECFQPAAVPVEHAEPLILFVGRVVPVKGPDLLLRAAVKLSGRGRRFRIRIVGSSGFSATDALSDYEKKLRALAEPLSGRIEFCPFLDRHSIVGEYQRASIFCGPSNWDEPFGLTIAEAMACGLPVVTSHRGGIPELGGDAVLYFDPVKSDPSAPLTQLLDSPNLCRQLGSRARERALQFRWPNQYQALTGIL